jgi:lambda repressor-like predicted transcriptional regulator
MHPADIQAHLKKAAVTQAEIARSLGVTPTSVSSVIHGRYRSDRIRLAISRAIGHPISQLWPAPTRRRAA